MRMSPNRGSSCWLPEVPTGCPPSETSARLTLVTFSQSDAACSICCSQVAVGVLRVQSLEQRARNSADPGAVGHEAVGDPAVVRPLIAQGRVEQKPFFQSFQVGSDSAVTRGLKTTRSIE